MCFKKFRAIVSIYILLCVVIKEKKKNTKKKKDLFCCLTNQDQVIHSMWTWNIIGKIVRSVVLRLFQGILDR